MLLYGQYSKDVDFRMKSNDQYDAICSVYGDCSRKWMQIVLAWSDGNTYTNLSEPCIYESAWKVVR